MKKAIRFALVMGTAITLFAGSASFAADQDQLRTRSRLRDGTCLTGTGSQTQKQAGQMNQSRTQTHKQTRSQKRSGR